MRALVRLHYIGKETCDKNAGSTWRKMGRRGRREEKRERKDNARDEINIGMQISKYFSVTVAATTGERGGGGYEISDRNTRYRGLE